MKRPCRAFRRQVLSGLTLAELMIAVVLVGMIVLAIISLDVSSRRFLASSYFEVLVQNRIGPIVELMVKDISRAIGTKDDPGIELSGTTAIKIRHIDSGLNYADYSGDTWTAYRFSANKIERQICPDSSCGGTYKTFATNISDCQFSFTDGLAVAIAVTAKRDVSGVADPNPEVRLETVVVPRLKSS